MYEFHPSRANDSLDVAVGAVNARIGRRVETRIEKNREHQEQLTAFVCLKFRVYVTPACIIHGSEARRNS